MKYVLKLVYLLYKVSTAKKYGVGDAEFKADPYRSNFYWTNKLLEHIGYIKTVSIKKDGK